jgi:RNase adapter protein RapZ
VFVEGERGSLMLTFESFGFKRGVPLDADFVFDVRTLPNPHYDARLRPLTGLDQPVIDFLKAQPTVHEMIADIGAFVAKWLPHFRNDNRSYLTIAIGCTGGQHRSVFIAQTLATRFASESNVIVRHRDAPLDVGESSRLIA